MDRIERLAGNFLPRKSQHIPIRVILSYIIDYLIIIVLAVIYAALDKIVTPFAQPFSLNNYTIQYPYAFKERISIAEALIISFGFPLVVIAVYTLFIDGLFSHHRKTTGLRNKYTIWDRLWELNCGILGLCLAQGAAFVITGTLKNLCGKPRPDLISRCRPTPGAQDKAVFGLSSKAICTQIDKAMMQDGFRSFPSGHSSSSFAGLFYLSLYLAAKLHILDQRGEVWRTVIVIVPIMAASCIAMSRIMDARHHPFDVLFGSALGILCAWGSYRQYFPAVSHVWEKGRAYPIRTWGVPLKRPVPGRVLVDSNTGAVIDTDYADETSYGVNLEPLRQPAKYDPADDPRSVPGSQDVDLDTTTEYRGVVAAAPITRAESSGNVFRDQISRARGMRSVTGQSSPDQGHPDGSDGDEDAEDISSIRPLQPTGTGLRHEGV